MAAPSCSWGGAAKMYEILLPANVNRNFKLLLLLLAALPQSQQQQLQLLSLPLLVPLSERVECCHMPPYVHLYILNAALCSLQRMPFSLSVSFFLPHTHTRSWPLAELFALYTLGTVAAASNSDCDAGSSNNVRPFIPIVQTCRLLTVYVGGDHFFVLDDVDVVADADAACCLPACSCCLLFLLLLFL